MKGIIPAAGLGTRMLPATKAQPKEMLPVAKKPVIQYIVEELEEAGIRDILIITGKDKRAIDDHFDRDPILLADLKRRNKVAQVQDLEALENLDVQIFYVRQAVPTGLADAVYQAKRFINGEDFVVALGDTIIDSTQKPHHLNRLINYHIKTNAFCSISTERVPPEHSSRYGILDVTASSDNGHYTVNDLVEKPAVEDAPSDLAICGRYIFKPAIFDYIERIGQGFGNEKQLTDAIRASRTAGKIIALELNGNEKRYDIGSFSLYAKAFVDMCLKDKEIGPDLRTYLKQLVL